MTAIPPAVAAWHAIVEAKDPRLLDELLADEAVFRSPAVHTPQVGRALTTAYLTAALAVLGPSFRYIRQWYGDDSAVLEFEAELDGLTVHGIDLLHWNEDNRLVEFTVMVRPLRGLQQLITQMTRQLGPPPSTPPQTSEA